MPQDKPDEVAFTQAELVAVDALIAQLQEQGAHQNEVVPLFTPVAQVVASAVLSTAAVLCARVESDAEKVKQIMEIAKDLGSTTTLGSLIELRNRAVQGTATKILASRQKKME